LDKNVYETPSQWGKKKKLGIVVHTPAMDCGPGQPEHKAIPYLQNNQSKKG
jgi:hypothetical protein